MKIKILIGLMLASAMASADDDLEVTLTVDRFAACVVEGKRAELFQKNRSIFSFEEMKLMLKEGVSDQVDLDGYATDLAILSDVFYGLSANDKPEHADIMYLTYCIFHKVAR